LRSLPAGFLSVCSASLSLVVPELG
jgi:hypothetical protein